MDITVTAFSRQFWMPMVRRFWTPIDTEAKLRCSGSESSIGPHSQLERLTRIWFEFAEFRIRK